MGALAMKSARLPFRATRFKLGDLVQPRFEISINPHSAGGQFISTDDTGVITEILEDGHLTVIHALFGGRITSWGLDDLDVIAHGS